ncbi:ABC transporter permease [Halioxenophilus sp. WMMB6]|uniref:ABC transporter permease n=1 Tax=Halioxenophilus sp. WMMB6 TaxID=3073815 RepID=UPI00295E9CB3|nr:ABC transporter permease [Halioxenophilus sp. WMMB6]
MTIELLDTLLFATLRAAVPLIIAGIGILILEKSGVLNLGQEGVLSVGAVVAFIVAYKSGSLLLACLVAAAAGVLLVLIFAWLVLYCNANQVVTGLSLSIFGIGFSAFIGGPFIGLSIEGMPTLVTPGLSSMPVIGKVLFNQDPMTYATLVLFVAALYFLQRTRAGMILRSVGENPQAAHALGYSPNKVRLLALVVSGVLVALAGSYLSLVYTPILSEGLSAGRGWIALALVVFASHRLGRLVLGALLFGFTSIMHLVLQGMNVQIPGSILAMMPYIITIVALVIMSIRDRRRGIESAPKALGHNFSASH